MPTLEEIRERYYTRRRAHLRQGRPVMEHPMRFPVSESLGIGRSPRLITPEEAARQERQVPVMHCPVCGGVLAVSRNGDYIMHDHTDDAPGIRDELRHDRYDPYGWGGY